MAKSIGYNGLSTGNSSPSDRVRRSGGSSGSDFSDDFFEVGRAVQESISKITILADAKQQEILHRLDSDYKAFARGIQSALNEGAYFRQGAKSIDPATGHSAIEYYVQTSELQNALSAIRTVNGKLQGASYQMRPPQQMDYITGTRTFEGHQAQAKAQYEIGRRGGKLLASPTLENPDQYTYMLPFSSDWATGVAQEDWLNQLFRESDALSGFEHSKRASEAEIDLNYAKARKAEMMKKLSASQAKEAGGVWDAFEAGEKQKEMQAMKDNYALSKQMRLMDELSDSQAKEASGVWAEFEAEENRKKKFSSDVEYGAWKRTRRENVEKDKEKQREEDKKQREEAKQKAKEALASKTKRLFIIGQIASMFGVLLDLTRRILTASLAMASQAKRTETEARNIGSSYSAMLSYNYTDKAYGLKEGTTASALFGLQKMFGDPANLDTNALGKLAMVMGNSVGDAVQSGLGGKNPEALMEMIMDAFLKAQQAGVNQFGQQVGQEEARRNLYTLLSEISPEIALLFSRAVEANSYGINKGQITSWQDYLNANKRIQGGISDQDLKTISTLGEVVDQLKAKFSNLVNLISSTFLLNLTGLIDKVNNWNWGKNEVEQEDTNQNNLNRMIARRDTLVEENENTAKMLETTLGAYGATGSLEEILFDLTEDPSFYNTAEYTVEELAQKRANKEAVTAWYASNPMARGIIKSYLAKQQIIGEIEAGWTGTDKYEYKDASWSDEAINSLALSFVSMALEPKWADTFYSGVNLTKGWENVLVSEGYGDKQFKSDWEAYVHFRSGIGIEDATRLDNAYSAYLDALIKKDRKGNTIVTEELKRYREAIIAEYTAGMSKKDAKAWKKANADLVKAPEELASDEMKLLAYIKLMVDSAYGDSKSSAYGYWYEATGYNYTDAESALRGLFWQRDADVVANKYAQFLTESGTSAVGDLTSTGFSVVPQGGGIFTIRFNAEVNGEKIEKEYKNVPLSGKYENGVNFQSDETGKRVNEGSQNASN